MRRIVTLLFATVVLGGIASCLGRTDQPASQRGIDTAPERRPLPATMTSSTRP